MRIINLTVISALFGLSLNTISVTYAQSPSAEACTAAQTHFISVMGDFRTAYFEREDAAGSAESVMADQVLPNAERVYQACPADAKAAFEQVVKGAKANLDNPNRAQIVQCDKALITYKKLLARFNNGTLTGGYNNYRDTLNQDLVPSAQAAIDACPQMTELTQQTNLEIAEQQRGIDRMEDLENAGPSIADNIATNNELLDSDEDDE
jgi:hypothetical protein